MESEPEAVIAAVAPALENMGVRYFIGGSIASSTYGAHRATFDVDFVAELCPEHVSSFVAALQNDFFIDEELVKSEVHPGGTFNIFLKATSDKADFFVPDADDWYREQMSRRIQIDFETAKNVYIATPEDI